MVVLDLILELCDGVSTTTCPITDNRLQTAMHASDNDPGL
jgi:hypothetical protein